MFRRFPVLRTGLGGFWVTGAVPTTRTKEFGSSLGEPVLGRSAFCGLRFHPGFEI